MHAELAHNVLDKYIYSPAANNKLLMNFRCKYKNH